MKTEASSITQCAGIKVFNIALSNLGINPLGLKRVQSVVAPP